jgi:hypothetical protein
MEPRRGNEAAPQPAQAGQANSGAQAQPQGIASPPKNNLIEETRVVFVQISFLYTNPRRERVLRIINHGIKVSNSLSEIYENCDYTVVGNSWHVLPSVGKKIITNVLGWKILFG